MTDLDQFPDQVVLAIAKWVYDLADAIAAERAKRISPISVPFSTQPESDLFNPRLVFIGSDGKVTAGPDLAVAVVLPQYLRMFTLRVDSAKNWNHANEIAAKCNVLALGDWYLPSVKELELLVCRDRMSPGTYPALVKHTPLVDWYWSRDPHPSDSSIAFLVAFARGGIDYDSCSNGGLVRACREVSAKELSAFGL